MAPTEEIATAVASTKEEDGLESGDAPGSLWNAAAKRDIFKILAFLMQMNYATDSDIVWDQEAFVQLNIPTEIAKLYVRRYRLCSIVKRHVVRSVSHHAGWVMTIFGGMAIDIPLELLKQAFAQMERTNGSWDSVASNSIGGIASLKPKRVRYRKFSHLNSKADRDTIKLLRPFYTLVSGALSTLVSGALNVAEDNLSIEFAMLKSQGYATQLPHYDFPQTVLNKHPGHIFLGLTPLTEAGAYLQLWQKDQPGEPGNVVYIPYGHLLVMPGDTLHGGGFQQCSQSLDPRLLLYIYIRPAVAVENMNRYQSLVEHPMHPSLDEDGGLLHNIFSMDQSAPSGKGKKKSSAQEKKKRKRSGRTAPRWHPILILIQGFEFHVK